MNSPHTDPAGLLLLLLLLLLLPCQQPLRDSRDVANKNVARSRMLLDDNARDSSHPAHLGSASMSDIQPYTLVDQEGARPMMERTT